MWSRKLSTSRLITTHRSLCSSVHIEVCQIYRVLISSINTLQLSMIWGCIIHKNLDVLWPRNSWASWMSQINNRSQSQHDKCTINDVVSMGIRCTSKKLVIGHKDLWSQSRSRDVNWWWWNCCPHNLVRGPGLSDLMPLGGWKQALDSHFTSSATYHLAFSIWLNLKSFWVRHMKFQPLPRCLR